LKPTASPGAFEELDIRVGRVLDVQEALSRKPTYRLTIDFGDELGVKRSCGAYRNYPAQDLIGKLVIAVVNLVPKKMGPEVSEVLVLGVSKPEGGTIYLTSASDVPKGSPIS
jgi:tRNA-binding protein